MATRQICPGTAVAARIGGGGTGVCIVFFFWSLLPFVLPQALYLRKTAPRFSGAAGDLNGVVGNGRDVTLYGIGDSIIAGVGAGRMRNALVGQTALFLSEDFQCRIRWFANGSVGADSRKVIDRLIPLMPDQPADLIVVSVGVNDVTSLSHLSTWRKNLSELIRLLRRHSSDAIIAVAGIPPLQGFPLLPQPLRALFGIRGKALDKVGRRVIASHENTLHVPLNFEPSAEMFSADGYHPSVASYRMFGRIMADRIIAYNSPASKTGFFRDDNASQSSPDIFLPILYNISATGDGFRSGAAVCLSFVQRN